MTPQEILASLSRLESELSEVASARLLVEQTANSYKDVQKELRSFVNQFQSVIDILNTIASAFQDEDASIETQVTNSIEVIKAQLDTLNQSFSNQCDSAISQFVNAINKSSDQLKAKTIELTSDYAANNDDFKNSINELSIIHASLLKASESIISLKTDVSALKDDLKASQYAQDIALAELKQNASAIESKQAEHRTIIEQAISDIATIHNAVSQLDSSLSNQVIDMQSKIDSAISALYSVRTIAIVNIAAIIIAIILLLLK